MKSESGVALVAALLIMLLMSTLLAGFTVVVMSDQQNRWVDRERTKAFYASHAGIEKMTADLGALFATNVAPDAATLTALQTTPPTTMPDITFVAADGSNGYKLTWTPLPDGSGNPAAQVRLISSGPFEGMTGLVTSYTMDVTAKTVANGETHLRRPIQTVAIPVFQFGIFSETDLSFFPGPIFNFGGRVHTNNNLFLAAGSGLTLADRVTAVKEVIRTNLSNGWPTSGGYTANVTVVTNPGHTRPLAMNEGSLVGTIGTGLNDPTWWDLVTGPYAGNLRNGRTGARRLDLALVTIGGSPVDLVRRPATATENVTNPSLFGQRYFSYVSLRILLSDSAAAIQNLPTVTGSAPVSLDSDWTAAPPEDYNPAGGGDVDGTHPPVPLQLNPSPTPDAMPLSGTNTPLLGGVIKIEAQDTTGAWRDVTVEILNLGFAGKNLQPSAGGDCAATFGDPNPDAVIRLQRIRDIPSTVPGMGPGSFAQQCGITVPVPPAVAPYPYTSTPSDFWPNVLYDPREGNLRDVSPSPGNVALNGVMHYVELDVKNLSRWFRGEIGASGSGVYNVNGYTVYFSDRRTNSNGGNETGEFGNEDNINPATSTGNPNGTLDAGEDANGNGVLDTYGAAPIVVPSAVAPMDGGATPWTYVNASAAKSNRAIFFRRALKLTNGGITAGTPNIVAPGLTVVSENPVYVQGNYNADPLAGFTGAHVATAIIADAVTLLSNNYSDQRGLANPDNLGARPAANTWYRVAVISGKTPSFPLPTGWGATQDFGTDGGVHNFLRYIENWGNGSTLWYRGSLASFYFSRQATGTYKCCNIVYSPPTRAYNFDIDFLTPSLLPPKTPAFRDVNALGFTQITAAGR